MLRVVTETGSLYEFDMDNLKMRRADHTKKSDDLRRDGEWLQMLLQPEINKGQRMHIALEPLGEGEVTMRYTTPVLSITEF